jgi:hypothetical protein
MEFLNELLSLFLAWVFPIVYQWEILIVLALALFGFHDAKKDHEASIAAWNDVTSGRTTIINTQDFIAGKLVTNGYTLQKSNVILGLILVVFLMK